MYTESEREKIIEEGVKYIDILVEKETSPTLILMHIYRTVPGENGETVVDREGEIVTLATAMLLNAMMDNDQRPRELLIGADNVHVNGGANNAAVYPKAVSEGIKEEHQGFVNMILHRKGGKNVHGTRDELLLLMERLDDLKLNGVDVHENPPLVIARLPHIPRITEMCRELGIPANIINAESIVKALDPARFNEILPTLEFSRFEIAEMIKMIFNGLTSECGLILEIISRILPPYMKDRLLDALGHQKH